MTKFLITLLAACTFCSGAALALEPTAANKAKPAPSKTAAKPAPAAVEAPPAPKKRGIVGRMFGKKSAPEPVAAPVTATPPPAASAPRKPRATSDDSAATKQRKPVAEKAVTAEKPAEPAPAKTKKGAKATAQATAKKPATPPANEPPDTQDPEVLEKWKLTEAKSKALEDAELREIKNKADAATTDEESRRTLRIYNKALFSKIREIDPSIKERANLLEAAILKQLSDTQ
ncbi:MAG: hypothetical protein V4710_10895 [Verrucomicrobiota bacterium]